MMDTLVKRPGQSPELGDLSKMLKSQIKNLNGKVPAGHYVTIKPIEFSLFASAAIEMWERAIHSFLISAATYRISPIWSSVSGYYSSHYCVRGLAHLLGYFQIYKPSFKVQMKVENGKFNCYYLQKKSSDGEHRFYWKTVKKSMEFENNNFFTENIETSSESDVAHRSVANYYDHINIFPQFTPLDKDELISRIERISKLPLDSVPIPKKEDFPDVNKVQLIAYCRIIIFRNYLDEILQNDNQYWKSHRNPSWCREYIDFQKTNSSIGDSISNIIGSIK